MGDCFIGLEYDYEETEKKQGKKIKKILKRRGVLEATLQEGPGVSKRKGFKIEKAVLLAKIASLAYSSDVDAVKKALSKLNFSLYRSFENTQHDSKAFFAVDNDRKTIIICFTGTSSIKDIWTDIRFKRKVYERFGYTCRIHSGFLDSYLSIKDQIWESLSTLLARRNAKLLGVTTCSITPSNSPKLLPFSAQRKVDSKAGSPVSSAVVSMDSILPPLVNFGLETETENQVKLRPKSSTCSSPNNSFEIFIIGHSLGGALASIAGVDLKLQLNVSPDFHSVVNKFAVYTFGCPRVGDPKFASLSSRLLEESWRIVNKGDVVCSLPPSRGGPSSRYQHVQTLVLLGKRQGVFGYMVDPFPVSNERKMEDKSHNQLERKLWKCGALNQNDAHTNYLGVQFPTSPQFRLNKALWKVAENIEEFFEDQIDGGNSTACTDDLNEEFKGRTPEEEEFAFLSKQNKIASTQSAKLSFTPALVSEEAHPKPTLKLRIGSKTNSQPSPQPLLRKAHPTTIVVPPVFNDDSSDSDYDSFEGFSFSSSSSSSSDEETPDTTRTQPQSLTSSKEKFNSSRVVSYQKTDQHK